MIWRIFADNHILRNLSYDFRDIKIGTGCNSQNILNVSTGAVVMKAPLSDTGPLHHAFLR